MGRAPCCDKAKVKRGPWSPEEDATLKSYLQTHGSAGNWIALPTKAGLKRCGKSCRLRWLNYLRPDIKHGGFTEEEDHTICNLYNQMGSRWSVIASQLPGRTDNDVKNYWNTKLKKKLFGGKINIVTQIHNNHNNNNNHNIHNNNNNSSPISLQPHISRLEPNEPISSLQKSTTLSMLTDINDNHDQKLTSFLYDHHQLFSPKMFMELLSDDQYQHFDNNNNINIINNNNNNANHVTNINNVPLSLSSQDHQAASGTTTTATATTSDHSSSVDVKPRGGQCDEFGGPASTEFGSDLAYNYDIIDGERAAFAPSYNSLGNNYYFC